jgi:hypothetical protein
MSRTVCEDHSSVQSKNQYYDRDNKYEFAIRNGRLRERTPGSKSRNV